VRHAWTVAFSPDGTRLLTAGGQNTVKVWDTATWTEKARMPVALGVRAAAFSPDGKIVATASETNNDPTVRLWDTETGQERAVLQGATGLVFCLRFTPDGKTLFASGDNAAVHVWDVPQPKAKPAAVASK
jgi:WD40 repeat protein